jgi:glycosyltransferase involved in cell wall biosynthesis
VDGGNGLLVPYRDAERLAAAILLLLGEPERARELGEAGRRRVTAELTWPRVARGFREALVFA